MLYLGGTWNFTDEYAETTGNNSVVFQYNAKNVYFVASAGNSTNVTVLVDGKPAGAIAGPDVRGGFATIQDQHCTNSWREPTTGFTRWNWISRSRDYEPIRLRLDSFGNG